jgi:hypothetical protein
MAKSGVDVESRKLSSIGADWRDILIYRDGKLSRDLLSSGTHIARYTNLGRRIVRREVKRAVEDVIARVRKEQKPIALECDGRSSCAGRSA